MSRDDFPPEQPSTHALTPGAAQLVEAVTQHLGDGRNGNPGVYHWLLALVQRHGAMAETLSHDVEAATLRPYLAEQVKGGNAGDPLDPATVVKKAVERARARGKERATERDVARVILAAAGYSVVDDRTVPSDERDGRGMEGMPSPAPYRPRNTRPTPTLEQFGRDLTRAAQQGTLGAIVGREMEIELVVETLCRRTKRNPLLVGPAGVGKTAIVEGLAQRVARGAVPEMLRGVRIIEVHPSILVAGARMAGELEQRVKALVAEAGQDGIVLFIDEVHSIVGAGGPAGTGDIATFLKPALARGELACIAATTDDEYRRFIEPDAALERRFQPIRVQELSAEETRPVLDAVRDDLERLRGVRVGDEVLGWLLDFAAQFLRNRTFPDKAVDLLEQCVAFALTQGKDRVSLADAQAVARRMVGMPLEVRDRLETLRTQLGAADLLPEEEVAALLNRLAVTMRGLDLRPTRPNMVMLLAGPAAGESEALASLLARALFGSEDRVVTIDFARFREPWDVTMLLGAPPGYVGYSEALPLHRVAQMPWCVLRCERVDACHPQVLQVLQQALANGYLTDARGKRVYLSDTIVLLTAALAPHRRPVGFGRLEGRGAERPEVAESIGESLGADLVDQIDLICVDAAPADADRRRWLEEVLLPEMAERYRKRGVVLRWDTSLVTWLLKQESHSASERRWERVIDERLSPLLIPYLPEAGTEAALTVSCRDGVVRIEAGRPGEEAR